MTALRQSVIGGAIVIVALALNILAPVETKTQPASAVSPAFDHSSCQYPYRWSNPVDGCDNSDPAVPECIKGFDTQEGEQACIADFVKQHETAPTVEPVQSVPETKVTNCEAK